MRFMVLVKANEDSEAGVLPSEQMLGAMGKYNEELIKAGVMLAGDGLQPSSKGARVRFESDKRRVIEGPFSDTRGLIAGYWMWQCRSKEEAIEWLKRAPFTGGEEVEFGKCTSCRISGRATLSSSTENFRIRLPANNDTALGLRLLIRFGQAGDDDPALDRWRHDALVMEPRHDVVHEELAVGRPNESCGFF
jgi:hypothetical protein